MSFKIKIHFLFSFLLIVHNVYAGTFNITEMLDKFPQYSTFNNYLTQSNVSAAINSAGTVTVLAVSNANAGPLSGKTGDDLAAILSLHTILDYFDARKLKGMAKTTSTVTTLYQQTGKAKGQQGFLNVTVSDTGEVLFQSAAPGSGTGAKYIGLVASQPYDISVLQVGGVIMPGSGTAPTTNASSTTPPPGSAPASSPGKTPVSVPTPEKSPESPAKFPPAPTPMAKTPEPAPSNASTTPNEAPAPSEAPAPLSNASTPSPSVSPTEAPGPGPGPGPGPDAAADAPASLGTHLGHNLGAMSAVILSNIWLFAMF